MSQRIEHKEVSKAHADSRVPTGVDASWFRVVWRARLQGFFINALFCLCLTEAVASPVSASRVFVVGEIKIASHAALDADEQGFIAGLADSGFHEGVNLRVWREDAAGSMQRAQEIASEFVKQKVDLIHSISTPSTLAVLGVNRTIPLVFSSVTDPVSAGIVEAKGVARSKASNHLTGVSDRWPVEVQMRLYQRMFPHTKRWGTIYNKSEPNSVLHINKMRAVAEELGVELLEATIEHSGQVAEAAASLGDRVQAFVITSDNTTVNNLSALIDFAQAKGMPVFAGDIDSVRGGAVAAFGMDYFLVGYAAGRKAGLILQGVSPGDIPWGPLAKFSFVINVGAAKRQGVVIDPSILMMADEIID